MKKLIELLIKLYNKMHKTDKLVLLGEWTARNLFEFSNLSINNFLELMKDIEDFKAENLTRMAYLAGQLHEYILNQVKKGIL